MQEKLLENHKRYLERVNFYKSFGYNIEEERNFILDKAQPLYGDILEVSTGKGYFTVALAKKGYELTSVDISEEEQQFARLNVKYFDLEEVVDFRIENAEHLSFKDKIFDIIFSINTLHHLENPFKVMDELIRVVTFEGKIILSDFTKEGFGIIDKIHLSEGRKHKSGKFTLTDTGNYLLQKGFETEKHRSRFQEMLIAYQPNI